MPTRKIADLPEQEVCLHPEHLPPRHQVMDPGVYEHICPGCGHREEFTIMPMSWL